MWSRKSAMLGSLAVAMYLLGLTLRNTQLVTIAVVIFVFLTHGLHSLGTMRMSHRADVELRNGPEKRALHWATLSP